MGKQVEFFMTYEDEGDFLRAVRQLGPLKLIFNTFSDRSRMEVHILRPVGTFGNDANLSLVNDAVDGRIDYEYFSQTASHCINLSESEVIQFNRCKSIDGWLANGRLWYEPSSSHGKKKPGFVKWANSVLRWIRANYREDDRNSFIGPRAFELSTTGKLRLGPPVEPILSLAERRRILGQT